jgi:hypothetical protein
LTNPHVQHHPSRSPRYFHHFDLLWRHEVHWQPSFPRASARHPPIRRQSNALFSPHYYARREPVQPPRAHTCTCATGFQSSSSSSAGAGSRRKTSSSTRLQPAGGQESAAEVREGLDSIFCNLGIFGNILKYLGISEIDT